MSDPTQLLAVTKVAEHLDCSRGHVYGLISAGNLAAVEIKATGTRSKTRVLAADVEAFIAANTRTIRKGGTVEARPVDGT